ncbi:MAG: PQQ-dependent sugar dehydrogenase [Verrucomicrobia bacterium]|nr:PQQ-dependent sugar dehydrogenase [Verrucomicrobiota bacterium]
MNRLLSLLPLGCVSLTLALPCALHGAEATVSRIPWTNTRLVGTPETPPPFIAVPAYPKLKPKNPIAVMREPGANRVLYLENYGYDTLRGVLRRFEAKPDVSEAEVLLELKDHVYSLTFHPNFAKNRFIYFGVNGPSRGKGKHTKILRYTFSEDLKRILPDSLVTVIEWPGNGHNGGDCAFGKDGMLYVTSGDGTSAMDRDNVGQDLSSMRGKVLRIDVDGAPAGKTYVVPADNPFVALTNARPEIWAYGLRNPWRITSDLQSGQIWVGENGQDLREYAHLLGRGENYGWSAYEGSRPMFKDRLKGPSPFTLPTVEHDHGEYRSLTGGVVYRGRAFPELNGAYIYGDYSTGRIHAMLHDGTKVIWHKELSDTPLMIVGFGFDPDGEVVIADYNGGIYRLAPYVQPPNAQPFARKLSETGLFADVATEKPAPGVVGYEINHPGWHDGAKGKHWIAAPSDAKLHPSEGGQWGTDNGLVLVQTLALDTSAGPRRTETRLLLKRDNDWTAYTYLWNDAQTDAELAPAKGMRTTVNLPEGPRSWLVPSRSDCLVCHSRAANFALSLNTRQLNRPASTEPSLNQIAHLEKQVLLSSASWISNKLDTAPRFPSLSDTNAPLEARVRSYLAVNCAHCHVHEGGGNSAMDLAAGTSLKNTRLIDQIPQHGTLNLKDARIVAPGSPSRSVLVTRTALRIPGQMPPLGTIRPDTEATKLFMQWISSLKPETQ